MLFIEFRIENGAIKDFSETFTKSNIVDLIINKKAKAEKYENSWNASIKEAFYIKQLDGTSSFSFNEETYTKNSDDSFIILSLKDETYSLRNYLYYCEEKNADIERDNIDKVFQKIVDILLEDLKFLLKYKDIFFVKAIQIGGMSIAATHYLDYFGLGNIENITITCNKDSSHVFSFKNIKNSNLIYKNTVPFYLFNITERKIVKMVRICISCYYNFLYENMGHYEDKFKPSKKAKPIRKIKV